MLTTRVVILSDWPAAVVGDCDSVSSTCKRAPLGSGGPGAVAAPAGWPTSPANSVAATTTPAGLDRTILLPPRVTRPPLKSLGLDHEICLIDRIMGGAAIG